MKDLQQRDLMNNNDITRTEQNKGQAEYIRWMGMQDEILRQKARVNWFEEGDANTKYFNRTIKDGRRRLQIQKIKDHRGNWIEGDSNIGNATVLHFQQFFNINHHCNDPNIINFGPDGYNGIFFQTCWEITKEDITDFVQAVFNGKLISENQSGFVKGRLITENILLAREIAQGVNKKYRGGNVIIKLDMAKAYDRISWTFLMAVMRKLGFSENWIDIIWGLLQGIWYSIIINGDRTGFFTSTQGLKQGDPLSPSLLLLELRFSLDLSIS
ncbi:PREDICTED: uncharacterized protein LOC109213783 [Nicotiana attenuata]|uniref:uncharacterized protein LOC109213783 n=1 Tax=Nicotiana attenuata TaxID=49451 RepID=UPI0009050165|nr:PREDICTED: uncharacterized protein LOC109213783 [Nicotiana attenuata]